MEYRKRLGTRIGVVESVLVGLGWNEYVEEGDWVWRMARKWDQTEYHFTVTQQRWRLHRRRKAAAVKGSSAKEGNNGWSLGGCWQGVKEEKEGRRERERERERELVYFEKSYSSENSQTLTFSKIRLRGLKKSPIAKKQIAEVIISFASQTPTTTEAPAALLSTLTPEIVKLRNRSKMFGKARTEKETHKHTFMFDLRLEVGFVEQSQAGSSEAFVLIHAIPITRAHGGNSDGR
ncbi:hypothetical protein LXL04_018135 [Taraxacum kok-saghyz]